MSSRSRKASDPKPLFAKLPISLHVALQEMGTKRLRKTGEEVTQKELLAEAIRMLAEKEGVDVSQIEADVSKWNAQPRKLAKIATIPRRPGRKLS